MGDPLVKGSAFNFINTAFKLSDYAGRISQSNSDHGAFVRMIESVRHDLAEVERLLVLQSVKTRLTNTPGKLLYIRGVVINAKTALNEIGKWVDRVEAEEETEIVTFGDRVRWVFNDHGRLVNQQMDLLKCQQDLTSVLAFLSPLEQTRFASAQTSSTKELNALEPDNVVSLDDVISPWQRRRMAREAGKNPTPKEPSREAPSIPLATPLTTSTLSRRPITRKRVGCGIQLSRSNQISPDPRPVESNPEVNQPSKTETSNSQSLKIINSSRPVSRGTTEDANIKVIAPLKEVSLDTTNSLSPTTAESHESRKSIDALPPRPDTPKSLDSDSTNLNRTLPFKTPRTIQTWPSTNINPSLFTAQEARRVSRPRPFHLPAKSSPHPSILYIGYSPVPSPSNSPEIVIQSTQSPKSHTRNHSTSLTTLPVPSCPSRLRSMSATNILGPINPFELPPESAPTSPELNINNATPTSLAPTQKTTRSGSMSRSQEVTDVATELLRAQSRKRNSLDIPKKPLRKPKSFNRAMELPTGFLSFQPVTTPPPIGPPESPPAERFEQRSYTEPVSDTKFQTIESSHNPPPEVVDTAYQFKSPNPPSRPNLVSQDQLSRHAMSWPTIPKNSHELPSNERPPSMLYTNQLPVQSPPAISPPVLPHIAMNTSFYAPAPRLYQPTSTASLPAEKGWDLRIPSFDNGKSKTVAEGRRNNRRALMDLMERGNYG